MNGARDGSVKSFGSLRQEGSLVEGTTLSNHEALIDRFHNYVMTNSNNGGAYRED